MTAALNSQAEEDEEEGEQAKEREGPPQPAIEDDLIKKMQIIRFYVFCRLELLYQGFGCRMDAVRPFHLLLNPKRIAGASRALASIGAVPGCRDFDEGMIGLTTFAPWPIPTSRGSVSCSGLPT